MLCCVLSKEKALFRATKLFHVFIVLLLHNIPTYLYYSAALLTTHACLRHVPPPTYVFHVTYTLRGILIRVVLFNRGQLLFRVCMLFAKYLNTIHYHCRKFCCENVAFTFE